MPIPLIIALVVIAIIASTVISVIQALSAPKPGKINFGIGGDMSGSPRYGTVGPLNNTISNELVVPVNYGTMKLAGNVVWQTDPGETVNRIVVLGEGQISAITDVRVNDVVVNDIAGETPGTNYTAYLGTTTQGADSRVTAAIQPDMEFHNTAYIAMTIKTSEKVRGGTVTVTATVDGMLVESWQNAVWNTTKAFSRNPVACVRDFILNARYGLGVSKANLDDSTFGSAYDYCEELVDAPSGKEARFRFDYVIDTQRPAQDILTDMLSSFNGFLVYAGNKIKLRIEKIEGITQYFGDGSTTRTNATFDPGNIVRDSFSWNISSIDEKPNRVRVQWVDPSQNYVKVYWVEDDRIDQDDRGIVITKDISSLPVTRQSQAARIAKFHMAVSKYAPVQISFAARLESIQCEIGDVVAVTHQAAKFTRRLFRIVNMQEAEDEQISFTCREYNASLYDDRPGTMIFTVTQPPGPNLYAPLSDVTNLTLLEDNYKNKDGVFVTNILVSWTALPDDQKMRLDRHLIQLSDDGGATYRDVGWASTLKTSYRIVLGNVVVGTVYTIRVKTISDKGAESVGVTAQITMQGKQTPPSNVENFVVEFAWDHLAMAWSAINDEDLFAYEIRQGNVNSVWETASIVTTENLGTRYDYFNFTKGTKVFFIKAIDNSGNYSEVSAQDSIVITEVPERNVIAQFNLWDRITQTPHPLQGTLSSDLGRIPTDDYNAQYYRLTFMPNTADTWLDLQNAGGTWLDLQNSSFRWGQEQFVTTEEIYTSDVIDLGSSFTGTHILEYATFSSSNLGFVSPELRTSTDNITWSAWNSYVPGQYTARYVQYRFLIQATNASTKVRLVDAILTVDVPDRKQEFLNVAIDSGGTTINLSGFIGVKSIVITTVGTSNYTPRIHDQSGLPSSFVVKMFDTGGSAVSGSVNAFISGY